LTFNSLMSTLAGYHNGNVGNSEHTIQLIDIVVNRSHTAAVTWFRMSTVCRQCVQRTDIIANVSDSFVNRLKNVWLVWEPNHNIRTVYYLRKRIGHGHAEHGDFHFEIGEINLRRLQPSVYGRAIYYHL